MKKHYITAFIAGVMIMTGIFFGKFSLDFLWGAIFATGIMLGVIVTLGQWLQQQAEERYNKRNLDEVELHDLNE